MLSVEQLEDQTEAVDHQQANFFNQDDEKTTAYQSINGLDPNNKQFEFNRHISIGQSEDLLEQRPTARDLGPANSGRIMRSNRGNSMHFHENTSDYTHSDVQMISANNPISVRSTFRNQRNVNQQTFAAQTPRSDHL